MAIPLFRHWLKRRSLSATRARGTSLRPRSLRPWLELLESRLAPAVTTRTWTGLGADNSWKNAANWNNGAPVPGDKLIFQAGSLRRETNVNTFAAGTNFASISVEDGYVLSGARVVLNGDGITSVSGINLIQLDVDLTLASQSVDVQVGTLQIGNTIAGSINGTGGPLKQGIGTLILGRSNGYQGTTTITEGVVNIQNSSALGSVSGSTVVLVGATLELQNNIAIPAGERLSLGSASATAGTLRNVSGTNSWAGQVALRSKVPINKLKLLQKNFKRQQSSFSCRATFSTRAKGKKGAPQFRCWAVCVCRGERATNPNAREIVMKSITRALRRVRAPPGSGSSCPSCSCPTATSNQESFPLPLHRGYYAYRQIIIWAEWVTALVLWEDRPSSRSCGGLGSDDHSGLKGQG
jgi:autotransporter-associated beta strand protein